MDRTELHGHIRRCNELFKNKLGVWNDERLQISIDNQEKSILKLIELDKKEKEDAIKKRTIELINTATSQKIHLRLKLKLELKSIESSSTEIIELDFKNIIRPILDDTDGIDDTNEFIESCIDDYNEKLNYGHGSFEFFDPTAIVIILRELAKIELSYEL